MERNNTVSPREKLPDSIKVSPQEFDNLKADTLVHVMLPGYIECSINTIFEVCSPETDPKSINVKKLKIESIIQFPNLNILEEFVSHINMQNALLPVPIITDQSIKFIFARLIQEQ